MALFFQTKKFKKQNARWKKILQSEGFSDCDDSHNGTVVQDLSQKVHFKAQSVDCTRAYYSWAESVTFTARYRNSRFMRRAPRKRVWRLHCLGLNNAEVGRLIGLSRWTIEDTVKAIRVFLRRK